VLGEQPRAEIGLDRRDTGRPEAVSSVGDAFVNGHDTAVASFSFSDW
jgi:hypothetical protein